MKDENLSDFLDKSFVMNKKHFKIADILHGTKVTLEHETDEKLRQIVAFFEKMNSDLREAVQNTVNDIKAAFDECLRRDNILLEGHKSENILLKDRCDELEKEMDRIRKEVVPPKDGEKKNFSENSPNSKSKGKKGRKRSSTPVMVKNPNNLHDIFNNCRLEKIKARQTGGSKRKQEIIKDIPHKVELVGETQKVFSLEAVGSSLRIVGQENRSNWDSLVSEKGILFSRGCVGLDTQNAYTILTPLLKRDKLTVEAFIHSKILELEMDRGEGTEKHGFVYGLAITENQIQFKPKPNTPDVRKEEINFFVLDESGFRFVSVFEKKKKYASKASPTQQKPPAKNTSGSNKQATNKSSGNTKKTGRKMYPEDWKGTKYENGYRGKKYSPEIAEKNKQARANLRKLGAKAK